MKSPLCTSGVFCLFKNVLKPFYIDSNNFSYMKKLIFLMLAATIVALLVFAVVYGLMGYPLSDSKQMAISIGITDLMVEYVRPAIAKGSKHFDLTANKNTLNQKPVYVAYNA